MVVFGRFRCCFSINNPINFEPAKNEREKERKRERDRDRDRDRKKNKFKSK